MGDQSSAAAPESPAQRRRTLLQAAKAQVIDHYRAIDVTVTAALRGTAKAALERELAKLPLEELPLQEIAEVAAAVRDQVYAPVFREQAREVARQRTQQETRDRKAGEELAAHIQTARRKDLLIQHAVAHALTWCDAKQISAFERLSVGVNIKSSLDGLLTGAESIAEAQAVVRYVLDARLAEADAKLTVGQAKQAQKRWDELMGLLGVSGVVSLFVLPLLFPAQVWMILGWLERTFGLKPAPEASPTTGKAPETAKSSGVAGAPPHHMRQPNRPAPPPTPETHQPGAAGPEPAGPSPLGAMGLATRHSRAQPRQFMATYRRPAQDYAQTFVGATRIPRLDKQSRGLRRRAPRLFPFPETLHHRRWYRGPGRAFPLRDFRSVPAHTGQFRTPGVRFWQGGIGAVE